MLHIHFGAGRLGLGFSTWLFSKAGAECFVVNRSSHDDSSTPPDQISKRRRNELLRRCIYAVSDSAMFDRSAQDPVEYVGFEAFIEYSENNAPCPELDRCF